MMSMQDSYTSDNQPDAKEKYLRSAPDVKDVKVLFVTFPIEIHLSRDKCISLYKVCISSFTSFTLNSKLINFQ